MNLIQYASKKERVHVEQIIREQPVLKDADNVTIKTISVRKSLGLTMDVFAPAAASDEPLPVLVDIHGGGLIAGRKEQNRNFCIRMAQNGYLVFAPDYRLVPETNIFGQISDVLEALTVIEDRASEFGGDVRNLFIVADSAGAFLASIVLTTRRYDMYRFVVYQYEDTAMVNTCPLKAMSSTCRNSTKMVKM